MTDKEEEIIVELKKGDTGFILIGTAIIATKIKVLEVTEQTIVLKELGKPYRTEPTRYVKSAITFLELLKQN